MNNSLPNSNSLLSNKPALLIVNAINGFTDSNSPLQHAPQEVIEANQRLLSVFRLSSLPVCFSALVFENTTQSNVLLAKQPDLQILTPDSQWVEIDKRLGRLDEEPVFTQCGSSAWFGSELAAWLVLNEIDSVVVCGIATSGSVRATAVDCAQHNYPVWVASDACYDNNKNASAANLNDLAEKYATVKVVDDIIDELTPSNDVLESDYI